MVSLKVLDMDDNGIQEIPSNINTSSLNLEELYLSHNKITSIPDAVFELKGLKALYIFDNRISSTLPSKIGQLVSLEALDLEMNYFTGQLPEELFKLTSLKGLWMFSNMLTGPFSPKFAEMTSLNILDLSQNFLTGELPSEIGLFENITELHLKNNMITGQLPSELSDLRTLTILDLSMNHLNSDIILEIGELENLVALRLDNNYRIDGNGTLISSGMYGTIPSTIGQMKQLRELRLDNNFIQGPLPGALGNLENLGEKSRWSNILLSDSFLTLFCLQKSYA
jgi:Leucine-rich repeat (LRR) protein